MNPILKIARVRKSALPLPAYQSEHAAGIDLMADIDAAIEIAPRERRAVPTGIALEIPVGFEGQVRPRSGRALERRPHGDQCARNHRRRLSWRS